MNDAETVHLFWTSKVEKASILFMIDFCDEIWPPQPAMLLGSDRPEITKIEPMDLVGILAHAVQLGNRILERLARHLARLLRIAKHLKVTKNSQVDW